MGDNAQERAARDDPAEMSALDRDRDSILAAVRSIPEGFVSTYGDINPSAPRLAGRVLAETEENDLPWWRVVRADGSLAVGEAQRARLEAEGVPFVDGPTPRVDLAIAWFPARRQ